MTGVRWPSPPLPINTRGGGAERGGEPKQKGISGRKKKEKEGEPKRGDGRRKRRAGRIFLKRK
jgi:hypothetical protein